MITFKNLGRMGRLGNQMSEIAGTIGIAIKSGQDFSFPYWKNYDALERFGTTEDIDVQKYFVNSLPLLDESILFEEVPYYWGYRDEYFPHGNYNLNAHMQSEKFFSHCPYVIRHYFEMKDMPEEIDMIAIHLRFGDYDNHYHPYVSVDYIRKAMEHFEGSFLIFSDDIHKAESYFSPLNDDIHYASGDYIEQFKMMRSCKHFIISNSTYSWWAAWLGKHPDKKVICPGKWHGDFTGLDPRDIYCKDWIII